MFIYKNYGQEQLDLQYNNRFHVPDFQQYLDPWQELSMMAGKERPVVKDVAYGTGVREHLDVFPCGKPGSPTLIFLHGGYWQHFDKSLFYFFAAAFADYDVTTVIVNYPLAPEATMEEIVRSCSAAVDFVREKIGEWNGNADQLCLVGHSAGAHLAAMLMTEMERKRMGVRSAVFISGIFDLAPIRLSNINAVLKLNDGSAKANSPFLKEPGVVTQLLIAVGEDETAEFKDQSRQLFDSWKNKLSIVELMELPGLNHFSILDSVNDKRSLLHRSILAFIRQ